jgi:hypothetical protein
MNNTTLLAASPAVLSAETFEKTMSRVGKVDFINSFNNARFVRREAVPATETETGEAYIFRATRFAAEGVAKGGFNVYAAGGDFYIARRAKTFTTAA